jgi:hypothetical protein
MNFSELPTEQKLVFLFNQIKRDTKQIESLKNQIEVKNHVIKVLEVRINENQIIGIESQKIESDKILAKNKTLKNWQSLVKAFIKKHELKEEFNEFVNSLANNISE